jgi:hypothetical protein
VPRSVAYVLGYFSPMLKGLRETRYQFERPYALDSSDFSKTFGMSPTSLDEGLRATLTSHGS